MSHDHRQAGRASALERLSTPEQLDRLIEVTHPRAWLQLAALLLMLGGLLVWGWLGSIPSRVQGEGMLLGDDALALFVAGGDGKTVRPGMSVQIVPATVRPEEYGYLLGEVVQVSEFPVTAPEMQSLLRNEVLIQRLLALGAPFRVDVRLLRDPDSDSGYRWTAGGGPRQNIYSGTPARALVVVQRQRPLELALPLLKRLTGHP